jgi:ABC-2 type transport system permease protein
VAFQALVMVGLSVAVHSEFGAIIGPTTYMWIYGVLEGQSFFLPLMAIIIAGGSMSEEYEHGTADILLSKPITRVEYMSGKFLGGFSVLVMIEALTTFVGVVLGLVFFGTQNSLQFSPLMFLAIAYSSLIFFCLSFMLSEVFRGSTLAMLIALGILVASYILGAILNIVPGALYVVRGMPTWASGNFPQFVLAEFMTAPSVLPKADSAALYQAVVIIAVYAIVLTTIATYRLLRSDVTKKSA